MMLLPFIVIMVLPKLMNTADPETQKVCFGLSSVFWLLAFTFVLSVGKYFNY